MRLRGILVSLALLTALAGCGGGDAASPTTPRSSSATPSGAGSSAAQPAAAQRALTGGLRALLGNPAVDFRYRILSGNQLLTETSGRAFLDGGWSSSTRFDDAAMGLVAPKDGDDVDQRMTVRATSDDVFMQLLSWPEPAAGCWLRMWPGEAPIGLLAMTPKLPFYVGFLGTLHAVGFEADHDSVIIARTQLRSALLLLSGPVAQSLTLTAEQARSARIPVGVFTKDGAVTDVSVRGADVVQSVEEAGGTVPADTGAGLAQLTLTVRYRPSSPHAAPVTAPEPGLVMSADDLAARRGCREN